MTKIRLAWVQVMRDRHGRIRRYFRRPGFARVTLPGAPGSDEFMAAYQAALAGETGPAEKPGAAKATPGTVHAAVGAYLASADFRILAPETRRTRRHILDRWRAEHGDKRIAMLDRGAVERMMAAKVATPFAARNWLNTLRALMRYCVAAKLAAVNPADGVKKFPTRTEGYHTWTEEEIAQFEARHPIGTRARLAMGLMLYTAQRRSDAIRLGRQHIRAGVIHLIQRKTGAAVAIPVHPELQRILDAAPRDDLTFLRTQRGQPFSVAGFGNWMRAVCREAGLPNGVSSHGLRKAACRRLAEAGCSANEIASISGHRDIREIRRYTDAADQGRLARRALDAVAIAFPGPKQEQAK